MSVAEDITVLVVDDMADNLEIELQLMRIFDLEAHGTQRADEVLALVAAHSPAVLLTDINLRNKPGDRSGVDVARAVRAAHPDMRIVGYSSSVFDLGEHEKEVFDEIISRGDTDPKELVAATIRHSARTLIPTASYPLVDLDLQSVPIERFHDVPFNGDGVSADVTLADGSTPAFGGGDGEEAGSDATELTTLVIFATGIGAALKEPLAVRASVFRNQVEVFVGDHPELGGSGASIDEAMRHLLATMRWFSEDLRGDDDDQLGPLAIKLRSFLDHVYDPPPESPTRA